MNHRDVLTTAASILNERHAQYGAMELCLERAAKISSIITAKWITAYDVALVMHAVKLARLENNRSNPENYVDGINYFFTKKFGIYFVATSKYNVQPSSVLDIIYRMMKVFRDYCGVLNEESIRKNFVLIYEIIDDILQCLSNLVNIVTKLASHS